MPEMKTIKRKKKEKKTRKKEEMKTKAKSKQIFVVIVLQTFRQMKVRKYCFVVDAYKNINWKTLAKCA